MTTQESARRVLVTGAAGYIGSHAALRLTEAGCQVTGFDDLSRGHRGATSILEGIGSTASGEFEFVEGRIADREAMARLLKDRGIDVVMHFAAFAYVGESVEQPLRYYDNNAGGACRLLQAVEDAGVRRLVFSSTCASYGEPPADRIPISEDCPQDPINPYGRSKLMVERMIEDEVAAARVAGRPFAATMLRYFNVAGSDPDGRIGEDHRPETHLIPICLEVAAGRREALTIYGDDYATPDGTCIRDYVHVIDLVDAHLSAMDAMADGELRRYNVGLGHGWSVREVLESCRRVTGREIPAKMGERRPGDPPTLFADARRIGQELGWSPRFTDLDETVATAWRWMQANPTGYGDD
ncbi:MAG: UDP-glucose 4-epimerase GalE [Phycisphaera sp.]|nr:UDP-glucose 4-epimerase GalE [Phycisphaera sp.]